jgi:hypothetical protein
LTEPGIQKPNSKSKLLTSCPEREVREPQGSEEDLVPEVVSFDHSELMDLLIAHREDQSDTISSARERRGRGKKGDAVGPYDV